jgi:hypothetical protein
MLREVKRSSQLRAHGGYLGCSMKSAHRHVEHEIACVGMEENNALFMFHYL